MQVETVIEASEVRDRSAILRKGFRMGEWMVRPVEGMIDGRQGPRHLQPKSMDVLLCLATSPNHIVERDQLIEQVWRLTVDESDPAAAATTEVDACGQHRCRPQQLFGPAADRSEQRQCSKAGKRQGTAARAAAAAAAAAAGGRGVVGTSERNRQRQRLRDASQPTSPRI